MQDGGEQQPAGTDAILRRHRPAILSSKAASPPTPPDAALLAAFRHRSGLSPAPTLPHSVRRIGELANSISCECWWLLHFGEACTALAVFAMLSLQHYSRLV